MGENLAADAGRFLLPPDLHQGSHQPFLGTDVVWEGAQGLLEVVNRWIVISAIEKEDAKVFLICGDTPALVTGPGALDGNTLVATMTITCDNVGGDVFVIDLPFEMIDRNTLELSGPVSPSPVHRVGE